MQESFQKLIIWHPQSYMGTSIGNKPSKLKRLKKYFKLSYFVEILTLLIFIKKPFFISSKSDGNMLKIVNKVK